MRQSILCFLAAAFVAQAQVVSFGVKAGAPVTEALPNHSGAGAMLDTGRWTIGPTVELRLIHGFSFEVDALYRGYRLATDSVFLIPPGVSGAGNTVPFYTSLRQDTKAWDVPLLLKYRFAAGRLHPFVDAGYSFTHESSDVSFSSVCLVAAQSCSQANTTFANNGQLTDNHFHRGIAGGVGLEFKYGRIKIAPEIRYNRLTTTSVTNQVTVMVGVTF